MKRSDFITIGGSRVKKSEIVTYWEQLPNRVDFRTNEIDCTYEFNGTLTEFESLIFDDDNYEEGNYLKDWVREVQLAERHGTRKGIEWCRDHPEENFNAAIIRIKNGGPL